MVKPPTIPPGQLSAATYYKKPAEQPLNPFETRSYVASQSSSLLPAPEASARDNGNPFATQKVIAPPSATPAATNAMAPTFAADRTGIDDGLGPNAQLGLVVAQQAAGAGIQLAMSAAETVQRHVVASSWTVKSVAFTVAMVLLASSVLALFNVFSVVFNPFQYLQAIYNAVFAGAIVVMEGDPAWFNRCGGLQEKLFHQAGFLSSRTGRAVFYFYVGSMNLFLLPDNWLWKLIYLGIGLGLCVVGVLSLLDRLGWFSCTAYGDLNEASSASDSDAK